MLSGYRIMWSLVMFDLPMGTRRERRAYTRFRNFLLDEGFEQAQLSVYMRFFGGREAVEAQIKRIRKNLPGTGRVHILTITDKQFGDMVCFTGNERDSAPQQPEQLTLL